MNSTLYIYKKPFVYAFTFVKGGSDLNYLTHVNRKKTARKVIHIILSVTKASVVELSHFPGYSAH